MTVHYYLQKTEASKAGARQHSVPSLETGPRGSIFPRVNQLVSSRSSFSSFKKWSFLMLPIYDSKNHC